MGTVPCYSYSLTVYSEATGRSHLIDEAFVPSKKLVINSSNSFFSSHPRVENMNRLKEGTLPLKKVEKAVLVAEKVYKEKTRRVEKVTITEESQSCIKINFELSNSDEKASKNKLSEDILFLLNEMVAWDDLRFKQNFIMIKFLDNQQAEVTWSDRAPNNWRDLIKLENVFIMRSLNCPDENEKKRASEYEIDFVKFGAFSITFLALSLIYRQFSSSYS